MDLDLEQLEKMIREGYVQVQKHPAAELFIYNYTANAQYERVWNDVTLQCRGLILDKNGKIIARPFRKFFNLGEMEDQFIPDEPFEVYEKLDGSLGILYWHKDEAYIATRGSFTSLQSARANKILREKYGETVQRLDRSKTYLFEIIYRENRIVVDYGEMEDLILLAIIDTESGHEEELKTIGFPLVQRYDGIDDIHILKALQEANREGFVIKFRSGLRYKVKFDEYVRIHRIVTMVSSVSVWEFLKEGKPLDELLDRVPDEFYDWVKRTKKQLLERYEEVENKARSEFQVFPSRKENALYFLKCSYPSVLFHMLDKKDYSPIIWKMIRPEYEKPFATDEEQ
jgi:hypothetical protein